MSLLKMEILVSAVSAALWVLICLWSNLDNALFGGVCAGGVFVLGNVFVLILGR